MSIAIITAYLDDKPQGATPEEIAEHAGLCMYNISRSLGVMLQDGRAERLGGDETKRIGCAFRLVKIYRASVYKGDETLAAMQAVCRARLMGEQEIAA
jgi:hypothetical protein